MQQGNQQSIESEGFYSKTPASRLANKEIVKGKKLNVLNISKKLEKKGIESNKVIEITTMKTDSSNEDLEKDKQTSLQNTLNLNTGTAASANYSNCQSALLKKKKQKTDDGDAYDVSQGGSKSKIESMLSHKDMSLFKRLENKALKVMDTMDEKMIEALQRKEYEIVKSFQTTIKRLMDELSALNEKSKNENLSLLRDNTIMSLEKQVAFFRDQSFQLNNQIKDLEQENRMLMQISNDKDDEIQALQRVLKSTKTKLINTSSILEEQRKSSPSPPQNKKTESSLFMTTQPQFQSEKQKKFDHQTKSQSPLDQNNYIDLNLQLQPNTVQVIEHPIHVQEYDLYGQTKSDTFKLPHYIQTPNKTQSIQGIRSQKKGSPTSCQSVMVSEENTEMNGKTSNLGGGLQSVNTPKFIIGGIGETSTYLDIEALVSVYIQDKESQYMIKNALMNYVNNKLKTKNLTIQTLSKQLNDFRQNLAYHNQIQSESSELEELFVAAVEDTKALIQKRNNYQNGKFTSSDRIDLIQKFMSSEKFMQIVKAKVFNKKCCDNQNCLFNINTVEKKANHLLQHYGKNEQVQNYYASIRDLSVDEKINNILDVSMDKVSHQQPTSKNNNDRDASSLLQRWKMMNNISSKYKNDGNKSMLNNSVLNESDSKEYSSLMFDQNYLKEIQKNQQKIYRMNNQFRRMFKEEKIQDKEIDERLTGFINGAIHKLDFDQPRRKTSSSVSQNPNIINTLTSSFSNTGQSQQQQLPPQYQQHHQQQQPIQTQSSADKTRPASIRVTYRHGKIYN